MDILININKPQGITSQDAVTRVKRILRIKKAGHTGTLDPLATGLLLVCVNRATRLAPYFSDLDKEYISVMKLGETTDTQDAAGRITEKSETADVDESLIKDVMQSFRGKILQTPPMFSALKHRGRSLHEYARKGIDIEREPREVNIMNIELIKIEPPYVTFRALCSKGTYIRTLCHDIGQKLGTGAHMHALERTAIGPFTIKDSLSFEELKSYYEGERIDRGLYSKDEALSWLPEFTLKESMIKSVLHGNPVNLNNIDVSEEMKTAPGIRIKSPEGDLLAVGSYTAVNHKIKMDVVFV